MKCPKCQFENREGAKFCGKCRAKLLSLCPHCSNQNAPENDFCDECGHDLREPREAPPIDYDHPHSYTPKHLAEKILTTRSSIEGERKLVTVLFADVANYTSISEKLDPEEVQQIIDGCLRILMDEIHRYEGTINQFTGDGVMALFGAPLAHEDHAQRACHAALSIQRAVESYGEKVKEKRGIDFRMRVGLNSGPVIVGTIGDDLKMEYTAIGDTTNLASRMESLARPGSVLVSGNTHRLAREYFEFASLGEVAVKGKEKPQEAYELLRPSDVETRIEASVARGLTRFVGRGKELEALREAFGKAREGAGQVVGIVGEAGVGKSRLILELRKTISKDETACLQGLCLHYGGSMPYLPILDMLKAYFQIQEEDREYMVKRKVREGLSRLDEKLLGSLAPFHELLSVQVEDEKYLQLDPQQRRQRTFEAIRELFIRLSQEKPLVLAVEDLHWIDRTSQEFLDYLIGRLANTPILLVLLYRPEYTHTWGSKSYYTQVSLDQLSTRNSADLVQAILEEGEVVPELRDIILGRTGGNPLFVEELTHSLLENGSILRKNDHYVLTKKPSEIQVPDTIQGIIAARMDRVEESLKRIMQVASVIGREFAYRILAAITGMSEELKASLLNLQGLEFIYEKQLFPELEYIFKHALTQEVAYNSLLLKRRKEIHERIGRAIEDLYAERLEEYYEILAYHYVRSNNKDKAVEYLDLANQKAAKANAMLEAKGYFDQAMEILDTLPNILENRERRISLLAKQFEVFAWLLEGKQYHDLLTRNEPLLEETENPGLRGAFYASLAGCECAFMNLDRAIQLAGEGIELCKAAGNMEALRVAYAYLIFSHYFRGDFERVLAVKDEALGHAEARFDLGLYVYALCGASWSLAWLGRWDEAVGEAQKALDAAERVSDNRLGSFAAWAISFACSFKGDLDRAIRFAELSVEKAPTPADRAMSTAFLGFAWCRAGLVDKGVELLTPVVEALRAAEFAVLEYVSAAYLGEGYLLAGQYEKAREKSGEYLELATKSQARWAMLWSHRLLGEVALKTNPHEAAPHFEKAISIFREIEAENKLAKAYSGMGRYQKLRGEHAEARRYLTDALEIFERLGTLIVLAACCVGHGA